MVLCGVQKLSERVGRPVEKLCERRNNRAMTPAEEERQIAQVKAYLAAAFPAAAADRVGTAVAEAYHRFDPAHVRDFVPLLVERRAKQSLASQISA